MPEEAHIVTNIREFKIWRRQCQRQRHKSMTIGWMKKNNRAARVARFLVQCFDVVCQTTTWNFHIWGSIDNKPAAVNLSFFCLHMKTIRAKQAKVLSAYFVQRDQHGIITEDWT